MKAAARILLIVTATLISAECFRTIKKRQADTSSCQQNIATCAPSLIDQPFLNDHYSFNFGSLAPNIDQTCADYQDARQCLEPLVESCEPRYQQHLIKSDQILDYFCSDTGKSLLEEFQQSVCYTNYPGISAFWEPCSQEENYTTLINCIADQFTTRCGEVGGQIFTDLANIFNQETR